MFRIDPPQCKKKCLYNIKLRQVIRLTTQDDSVNPNFTSVWGRRKATVRKWRSQTERQILKMTVSILYTIYVYINLESSVNIIQILTVTVMKYHVSVDCQESYIFPKCAALRENIVQRENITILAPPTRDISTVPVDICYIRCTGVYTGGGGGGGGLGGACPPNEIKPWLIFNVSTKYWKK